MKKFTGFEHGMGIGVWLTNYKRFNVLPQNKRMNLTIGDMEHFESYITENDVKYIASLGMDHIRLGFDQIVVEESEFCYRKKILDIIEEFLIWCKKYNINVVLNLHKAIGNYCDIKEEIGLLDDDFLQQRFIKLWEKFETKYSDYPNVAFELLNEIRDVDPQKWNNLADNTIISLRKLNPNRKIIIGTVYWNDISQLKNLRIYDDENVIYTFHMYAPFEFTHQRGVLQETTCYYNREMPYPCDIECYRDFHKTLFNAQNPYPKFEKMDYKFIEHHLNDAILFKKEHPDKILWCGEFGTIRHANIKWRENYMRDVIRFFKNNDIPYCVWNYLSTPNDGNRFSLVDDDTRKILSDEMAHIIKGDIDND